MAENLASGYSRKQLGIAKQKIENDCVSVTYAVTESRQMIRINLTTSGSRVITVIFMHEIHTAK